MFRSRPLNSSLVARGLAAPTSGMAALTSGALVALVCLALAVGACLAGGPGLPADASPRASVARPAADSPGGPGLPPPADPEAARRLGAIREEVRLLLMRQEEQAWATRTRGAPSDLVATYRGHEDLFSPATIAFVRSLADSAADSTQARALRFLELDLARKAVELATAPLDDSLANAQAGTLVTVEGLERPLAFNDLASALANEADPARRQALEKARADVWRDKLNPIIARRQALEDTLVKTLGYPDYVSFSQSYRNLDLPAFLAEAFTFIRSSDAMYRDLLREQAQEVLGKEPNQLRRADLDRLSQSPQTIKFFPRELLIPTFMEFLRGMGLSDTTVAGTRIQIDDEPRPAKNPRPACFSIDVPSDIRISVKPANGLPDFEAFFHEGGHALHFGHTTTPVWEFQQLGNGAVTEAYAALFVGVWGDPAWLRHYRDFVTLQNSHGKDYPVMTDLDIARTVRRRLFWNLYMVRRFAGAKLLYETILHGGREDLYKDYLLLPLPKSLQEVYRQVFGFAAGFDFTPDDALRYRTDVDPFFSAADYARAYALAPLLDEGLNRKFGAPWFEKAAAGAFLAERFFSEGTRLQPGEAAVVVGGAPLSFAALKARLDRLYEESEAVIEASRK